MTADFDTNVNRNEAQLQCVAKHEIQKCCSHHKPSETTTTSHSRSVCSTRHSWYVLLGLLCARHAHMIGAPPRTSLVVLRETWATVSPSRGYRRPLFHRGAAPRGSGHLANAPHSQCLGTTILTRVCFWLQIVCLALCRARWRAPTTGTSFPQPRPTAPRILPSRILHHIVAYIKDVRGSAVQCVSLLP